MWSILKYGSNDDQEYSQLLENMSLTPTAVTPTQTNFFKMLSVGVFIQQDASALIAPASAVVAPAVLALNLPKLGRSNYVMG